MKIVTLSDWSMRFHEAPQTGFGRVHYHLLSYLHSKGHEVHEVGVGYVGQMTRPLMWPTYNPVAYGRLEGQEAVPVIANSVDADAVLILADVPDVAYLSTPITYRDRRTGQPLKDEIIAHIDSSRWKKLCYTVIDGACPNYRIPPEWERIFKGFDDVAIATKWGCDLIAQNTPVQPTHIPHGVDTNVFKATDKALARSRFGIEPDAFVILAVGVNRRRKMIPAWFETVAKFVARTDAKKVLFWLHSYRVPDAPGYDLQALANHYQLRELGVQAISTDRMAEEMLPLMYATADLIINLSNEGFGFVPLEGAACRVPSFVTAYTGQVEQVPDILDNFLRIPVRALIPQEGNAISWAWPDTDVAAERLEAYWLDKALRTKLKRASWEWAQKFSWDKILPRFENWVLDAIDTPAENRALTVEIV